MDDDGGAGGAGGVGAPDGCGAAGSAVSALLGAREVLFDVDLAALTAGELLELSRCLESDRRRSESLDHAVIAALVERGVAADLGSASTQTLLVDVLRLSPGEASSRVRATTALGPRRSLLGEPLAPVFAETAAAQRAGVISAAHANVITATIESLPAGVRAEHADTVERVLLEHARSFDPRRVQLLAARITATLDPDGTLATDADQRRRRAFSIAKHPDGSGDPRGYLSPECVALLDAALDPLAAPCSTTAGGPDHRTPEQRRHDALQELARRLLASGALPDTGGTPATVVLTMTLHDLETRTGLVTTDHGGTMTVHQALRFAADADLVPVIFGDCGEILAYGRAKRFATTSQRRALAARDKGCTFPTCDRPPAWTQAHHEPPWPLGGTTNLDTLTLVCEYHHHHAEQSGWQCVFINHIPHWKPPPWIDLHQEPIRNTTHDTGPP